LMAALNPRAVLQSASASKRIHCTMWFNIECAGISPTLASMGKFKIPGTGEGYLGEIMVHRISRTVGVVENVIEAKAGWPPQITLKLKDGTAKKGRLSDFREPTAAERKEFSPA